MSLDGFIAGPNDDMSWAFALDAGSRATVDEVAASTGALLAGRGSSTSRTACSQGSTAAPAPRDKRAPE
jgi:hypothetical protein